MESTAAGVASLALQPFAFAEKHEPPLGVQLYTVRELVAKDLPGTLKAIRAIGYQTVETFAGADYKVSAKELRQMILDAGLTVPSAHFGYNDLGSRFDYAKELGVECIVCGELPGSMSHSADGFKQGAEQYNQWGEKARQVGLRFGFHSHDSEFQKFGNATGFEILMRQTDPALVAWQIDVYWVAQAGLDPVTMMKRYAHRIQSVHLKDRKAGFPPSFKTGPDSWHFTEVGEGTLDWPAILRQARHDQTPYMFVEQDRTDRPPLESLKISYTNLKKFLRE